jgi:alpha-tubulin suppressor-like RCC1 family protein
MNRCFPLLSSPVLPPATQWLVVVLAPLLSGPLLSGCGEDSTAEELRTAIISETCSLNSDCEDPLVCAFERCHTECNETRDCPRDSLCVASGKGAVFICQLPDEAECDEDDDCPGKQRCAEDGFCRGGCSDDDECPELQRCVDSDVGMVCADAEHLSGGSLIVPGAEETDDETTEATDDQATDDQATDDQATDDQATDDQAIDGGTGGPADPDSGAGPVEPEDQTTVVFTAEGGDFEGLGVRFALPEDAVDDDTDVTIVRVATASSLPPTWTPLGGVFTVSGDLALNVAVTVRIPYESSAAGTPALAYRPDEDEDWELIEANFDAEEGYAVTERTEVNGEYVVINQQPEDGIDCSTCGDTQICQFNRCYDQCDGANPCDDGQECCDGLCADTNSDVNNCGSCDVVCEGDDVSTPACTSGFCEVASCEEPYEDCDGNADNGCEADLMADVRNCGGCGVTCGLGAECIDGECEKELEAIFGGERSTCVKRVNGKVLCWGGVAGSGAPAQSPRVVGGLGAILDITSAAHRGYAVLETGRLVSFGSTEWDTPVAEPITDGVAVSSTGASITCVLRGSGLVSCWGSNAYGQAGTGSTGAVDEATTVSGLDDAVKISVGQYHTCALREGGAPTCWGYNAQGRLGDGETGNSTAPRPVVINEGSSEAYQDFTDIVAGSGHSCGIRANGDVLCWGYNVYRALGVDNEALTQSVVPVIVEGLSDVASLHSNAYANHTCALHGDGTVSCWGYDQYGQLGRDSTEPTGRLPGKVPGVSDVISVAVGTYHTCALPSEGPPVCWGQNAFGQLGDGSATQRDAPVPVANLP